MADQEVIDAEVTQQPQAPKRDVYIDLNLHLDEVNLILNSLGKEAYAQVAGLINKLQQQAIPQLPEDMRGPAPQA